MNIQALEGVKVASFCWAAAGSWIVKYLAEHGAQVIHIESGRHIDSLRVTPPYKDGISGVNRSGYFTRYNFNQYCICLDMNKPLAREIAPRIVQWADIVAENYTPGTMEKWELDYENLRKIKPDIIMMRCTSQGETGPHRLQPGVGTHLVGLSGFLHLTGWPDRGSVVPYGAYTDTIAPRLATAALLAALEYRHRTGKGQCIDVSQYETAVEFLAPLVMSYVTNGVIPGAVGNRSHHAAPHGVYPCRGKDRWCAIAIFTDEEWKSLCQVMGNPEWTTCPRFSDPSRRKDNEDELDVLVAAWTINFQDEQLMGLLQQARVKAGVVQNAEDVSLDPQLKHRHYSWELSHPEMGKYHCDAPAFSLSETPCQITRPAPCLGQDNEYVFTKLLGMADEDFLKLLGEGVLE